MVSKSDVTAAVDSACMAFQVRGEMRPTIPKSMNATRPSLSTRRLPACTSAWNESHIITEPNLRRGSMDFPDRHRDRHRHTQRSSV